MKFSRSDLIKTISKIDYVANLSNLIFNEDLVTFQIQFNLKKLPSPILFSVEILPSYPFKLMNSESIRFKNINLIELSHVMADGSVCFHNQHCTNFEEKIILDFLAIKNWIIRYIINKESDEHYEHLVQSNDTFNNEYYSYQFTDLCEQLQKNNFGKVNLLFLSQSFYEDKYINNYLVQSFGDFECDWSNYYKKSIKSITGLYLFIDDPPKKNGKFSYDNWLEFEKILDQNFLGCINCISHLKNQNRNIPFPLFIGFKTKDKNIHWQVALIDLNNLFFTKNQKYIIKDQKIIWAISNNSSYNYFFGRGAFNEILTNSNILIIGIGAVGSQIAKILVKTGCKYITLIDHDIKEPGNICRSEYNFIPPLANKVDELSNILYSISPHVQINTFKNYSTEVIKYENSSLKSKQNIIELLDDYDYIFDCSTDDDLMFILDKIKSKKIINISITNHAESLVCGISPTSYNFVKHQFDNILKNNVRNLYNPLGCWTPTFKASYNDIGSLVQFALKHLNIMVKNHSLRNFTIQYTENLESLRIDKF